VKFEDWYGDEDILAVRNVFLALVRLDMVDRAETFNEFVEWMGLVSWYANVYKPR
jgi:hypothetical protein